VAVAQHINFMPALLQMLTDEYQKNAKNNCNVAECVPTN
jgi:hypothetical protein